MHPKLVETFNWVVAAVARNLPRSDRYAAIPLLAIENCPEVVKGAPSPSRAYAHVGHLPGKLCVAAKRFERLPIEHKVGILLHEIGHVGSHGGELAADAWVFGELGIAIRYRGKKRLQWVSAADIRRLAGA